MPRRTLFRVLSKARPGFTLIEMVIVIVVLAILVSISSPAIFQFLRQRDLQQEENLQMDLRKALQAYIAEFNKLPAEATWAQDLSGYTNLSNNEILNDVWGRPRAFITYTDNTRNLQGTQVAINYATFISAGPNLVADGTTGIATTGTAFADISDTAWWSNLSNPVNSFANLQPGADDVMTRFTDYPEKLERFNLTLQRMDRVAEALESYAKSNYANRVVECSTYTKDPDTGLTGQAQCDNGMPEKTIYYPRSLAVVAATDNARYFNTAVYVDNAQSDPVRRTAMQGLMRLLGLPDEFCCSAMVLGSDDAPKPFYYFSNPRPRASSGCGARPNETDTKLPARITADNNDSANPGTCG